MANALIKLSHSIVKRWNLMRTVSKDWAHFILILVGWTTSESRSENPWNSGVRPRLELRATMIFRIARKQLLLIGQVPWHLRIRRSHFQKNLSQNFEDCMLAILTMRASWLS